MKAEWKRFFLQWVLPVGVFTIVLTFMFASFTANIKQETGKSYIGRLTETSKNYANQISLAVQKSEATGKVVAGLLSDYDMKDDVKVNMLTSIVNNSDADLVVLTDSNGKGLSNKGASIDMKKVSYYDELFETSAYRYRFIPNDELNQGSSLIIKIAVGEDGDYLFIYFPMDTNTIKKNVNLDTELEKSSYLSLIDREGVISASTLSNDVFTSGNNVWDELIASGNNAANIRMVKTKVQSQSSGDFDFIMDGVEYVSTYTPITGTGQALITLYDKTLVSEYETKESGDIISKLSWITLVVILFVVVVTILNIIEIFIASKDTESLKDKADTDQLTGLKNKLATEREIKEYIAENPNSLGMLFVIDIDNFKKINDTMGHSFGDEVLRELGRHIGINFRVSDIIGRTGGDEFMVFLKNLKEDQNCLREAQKLIYFFRHFQVGDYVKYSVTASIGAAVYPDHGADFESLYKSADSAVYKSKKRGKNQLSFIDDRDRTPEEVAYADAHTIDIERKEETPIES